MSIYINLLLLAAVLVFIVDLSGWTDTLLEWVSRFTRRYGYGPVTSLRPFTCSLCSVWWGTLLYALLAGQFTLPVIAYCGALAYFSKTLAKLFIFIGEGLDLLIGKLLDLCTKE